MPRAATAAARQQLFDRLLRESGALWAPQRLEALAPKKDYWNELFTRLQWIAQLRQQERLRASVVTQFVVGAVGDTELELLQVSEHLYRQLGLRRAYYSTFHPVAHTPFEHLPAESDRREFRLYQASFLLRDYGWELEDLPFATNANLPPEIDPKLAWAVANLREAPVVRAREMRGERMAGERAGVLAALLDEETPRPGTDEVIGIVPPRRQERTAPFRKRRRGVESRGDEVGLARGERRSVRRVPGRPEGGIGPRTRRERCGDVERHGLDAPVGIGESPQEVRYEGGGTPPRKARDGLHADPGSRVREKGVEPTVRCAPAPAADRSDSLRGALEAARARLATALEALASRG